MQNLERESKKEEIWGHTYIKEAQQFNFVERDIVQYRKKIIPQCSKNLKKSAIFFGEVMFASKGHTAKKPMSFFDIFFEQSGSEQACGLVRNEAKKMSKNVDFLNNVKKFDSNMFFFLTIA